MGTNSYRESRICTDCGQDIPKTGNKVVCSSCRDIREDERKRVKSRERTAKLKAARELANGNCIDSLS